jgi:hypothetical protein
MKKIPFIFLCACLPFVLITSCSNEQKEAEKTEATVAPAATETQPQPVEFADSKYADIGKKGLASLSSGNIDGWMTSFADNVVWVWNSGDSVVGKAGVQEYWKKRRGEVIDSISFSNEINLPIKVNQPQATEQAGTWLLSWYQVSAKYKTGKRMGQWIHTSMHFDANDKIDRVIQFLDRVPINAAAKK